jgi:hypothetical protein
VRVSGADVAGTFLNSKDAHRLKAFVGRDLLDAERKGANFRFQIPAVSHDPPRYENNWILSIAPAFERRLL